MMKLEEYQRHGDIFKLGDLSTEKPHDLSVGLADLVREDLAKAIAICWQIDLQAITSLASYSEEIDKLAVAIADTLAAGHRIFICGCGATGRLAMTVEYLWRQKNPGSEQVRAFMAGGDIALVHSLEGFEDFPHLGARHAQQLGFTGNDLMIAVTEGGETPYVIGATEHAARTSHRRPFFMFCNRSAELMKVERSRAILLNEKINKCELYVGPMTIAGSTRMQASTVLQLALAKALFQESGANPIHNFARHLQHIDLTPLQDFVKTEAHIYQQGHFVLYVPYEFAITTFTDTTERSPTFSLPPFENPQIPGRLPSLSYIMIPEAENALAAWYQLLHREPIALNWGELDKRTEEQYLSGFDFSINVEHQRAQRLSPAPQEKFVIRHSGQKLVWQLKDLKWEIDLAGLAPYYQHTLLKLLLNTHSTLLMGLLGRYHSNIMTWVTPTNGKLIDRAARNVNYLLRQSHLEARYEDIINEIFAVLEQATPGQPIVLQVFDKIRSRLGHGAS